MLEKKPPVDFFSVFLTDFLDFFDFIDSYWKPAPNSYYALSSASDSESLYESNLFYFFLSLVFYIFIGIDILCCCIGIDIPFDFYSLSSCFYIF